jgi:hypothetical protein
MVGKRKYKKSASTSVKTENWKLDLLNDLKIPYTKVFNTGVDQCLDLIIQNGRVKSSLLERILFEKKAELVLLQGQIDRLETVLAGTSVKEISDKIRMQALEQVCLEYFGDDLPFNARKLPENDEEGRYEAFWDKLSETVTGRLGYTVTVPEMCQAFKNVLSREAATA